MSFLQLIPQIIITSIRIYFEALATRAPRNIFFSVQIKVNRRGVRSYKKILFWLIIEQTCLTVDENKKNPLLN
ncbi:hypothetical protein HZS_474 [Henneguya salminicola]|nr:hypothetical protein HZS_474 [Henneguya salminicola]